MTHNFIGVLVFTMYHCFAKSLAFYDCFKKKQGDKYYSPFYNTNFISKYLFYQRIASQILKVEGFLSLCHQ